MECPKGVTDGVEVRGLAVGQEEIPQELARLGAGALKKSKQRTAWRK